jgi:hypothetical protein
MSNRHRNRNQNQTTESIIMDYLLDALQVDNTNVSNDHNITLLIRVLDAYQRNAEMYHRNMGELINLLRTNMNTGATNASRQNTPRVNTGSNNTYRPWYFTTANTQPSLSSDSSNNYIPTTSTRTPTYSSSFAASTTLGSSNSSRDRRLTNYEINNAVTDITYSSEESETRCPISLEDFGVGESICRINTCRHIFKRNALYVWFNNHSSCPVCRTNVLSATINNTNTINNIRNTNSPIIENNIINDYAQSIAYNLLSSLNTNPSNIGTYTFDIPILYYDVSGNVGGVRGNVGSDPNS